MKLWSVPNIKSIRCVIFSLACCCAKIIREVVLFKTKGCGFVVFFLVVSCAVCCANFVIKSSGKLCTFCALFAWESCAFDIFYLFQKHGREHQKKNIKQGFSLSKICP